MTLINLNIKLKKSEHWNPQNLNKKQEKEITELKAKSLNLEVRGAKEEKLDGLE